MSKVLILYMHANLHESKLPVYIFTIAVLTIYSFDCHANSVLFPLIIYSQNNNTFLEIRKSISRQNRQFPL